MDEKHREHEHGFDVVAMLRSIDWHMKELVKKSDDRDVVLQDVMKKLKRLIWQQMKLKY